MGVRVRVRIDLRCCLPSHLEHVKHKDSREADAAEQKDPRHFLRLLDRFGCWTRKKPVMYRKNGRVTYGENGCG